MGELPRRLRWQLPTGVLPNVRAGGVLLPRQLGESEPFATANIGGAGGAKENRAPPASAPAPQREPAKGALTVVYDLPVQFHINKVDCEFKSITVLMRCHKQI